MQTQNISGTSGFRLKDKEFQQSQLDFLTEFATFYPDRTSINNFRYLRQPLFSGYKTLLRANFCAYFLSKDPEPLCIEVAQRQLRLVALTYGRRQNKN